MSYAEFRDRGYSAADASVDARAEFIKNTYLHLAGAIFAFAALSGVLVNSSLAPRMLGTIASGQFMWLLFLGGFMLVGGVAQRWAYSGASPGTQYAGLALYVVAEAVMLTPLLYIAKVKFPGSIASAGIITGMVFGGLTAINFFTKRDFNFLGRALSVAGFAAMGLIVVSILFGFNLGTLFSAGMVALAAGYILYQTSNIMHHYPTDAHVAASLALFASVALMFWYVLQLVMAFGRD